MFDTVLSGPRAVFVIKLDQNSYGKGTHFVFPFVCGFLMGFSKTLAIILKLCAIQYSYFHDLYSVHYFLVADGMLAKTFLKIRDNTFEQLSQNVHNIHKCAIPSRSIDGMCNHVFLQNMCGFSVFFEVSVTKSQIP